MTSSGIRFVSPDAGRRAPTGHCLPRSAPATEAADSASATPLRGRPGVLRRAACLGLCALLLSGCAEVQPWQRGKLARPEMQTGPSARESLERHVYDSKEASSGSAGGFHGGCGCN